MECRFLFAAALGCLALAACSGAPTRPTTRVEPAAAPACPACGRIERIDRVAVPVAAKPRAVLGGVVGGVLSKPAATTTSAPTRSSYRITVRMDDGRRLVLTQPALASGLAPGARVRIDRGRLLPLR